MKPTPQELIAKLGLEPHQEGGWFRQVYKSSTQVQAPQGPRSAVTTIYYFLRKRLGAEESRRALDATLSAFRVAAVDGAVVKEALRLPISDFEDAVTAAAAHRAGCQFIVTRDLKGFSGSLVRHLPPEAIPDLIKRV